MYKIKLAEFEGPLDLLLALVEKEDLDITRLSLAKVTRGYLKYLGKVENINPQSLADFLDVAAKLILIKSKALLPVLEFTEEEEEGIEGLENQLRRYQIIREFAKKIKGVWKEGHCSFPRESYLGLQVSFYPPRNLKSADTFKKYFLKVASELPDFLDLPKEFVRERISIGEIINNIKKRVEKTFETSFNKIVSNARDRTEIIISFLALLELIKQKVIQVKQGGLFSKISIYSHVKEKKDLNKKIRRV